MRIIAIGCVLLVSFIPFRMNGQYSLMVSGNGQLRMLPSTADDNVGVTYYNFIPQYKPLTKSITITRYNLFYNDDLGEYTRCNSRNLGECDGGCCSTIKVLYDEQGKIIKVSNCSFQYEDNRITEYQLREGYRCRFKYDSQNLLESATQGKWTYNYNLDINGNITKVNSFFGAESRGAKSGFQYDSNHRMIAYYGDYSDYRWNYDKDGNLISYRVIGYSFSKGKDGGKTSDHEYQFEYGEDGNPIRCIDYIHGDITVIDCIYEYEYTYVFYHTSEDGSQEETEGINLNPSRRAKTIYRPSMADCQNCPEDGKIIVEIWVDCQGNVIRASITEGTDITDNEMCARALDAARRSKFEPDPDPDAPVQKSKITYTFR